jgi:predicted RNA binding protein YcfA (HicA-like mRNA interferase family)
MKAISTSLFKKFLLSLGLTCIRTKGSHEVWDNEKEPLTRPVIIRGNKKEIPLLHIKTNLRTLGISFEEFQNKIKNL